MTGLVGWAVVLAVLAWALHLLRELVDVVLARALGRPPRVLGVAPLLGSAAQYKRDALGFLRRCQQLHGDVFTMNMAGARMTLLADDRALSQYMAARESDLSLYDAVNDFGFRETLGLENVYSGSAAHRRITRALSSSAKLSEFIASASSKMADAFKAHAQGERHGKGSGAARRRTVEMFKLMRVVSLEVAMRSLLGDSVVESLSQEFMQKFMDFQDLVEDATAKATVLPRFMASGILADVRKKREGLVDELVGMLGQCDEKDFAPYMKVLVGEAAKGPSQDEENEQKGEVSEDRKCSVQHRTAQYVIGLLFAAHKNIAITSAQLMIMLIENKTARARVLEEVGSIDESKMTVEILREKTPFLDMCLYETLRLTQHAIGSIRKVRSETGFHITTSDGRRLVVPKGHYVGSAHILIGRQAAFQCPDRFDPDQHFRRDESTRNKTVPLTVGGTSRRHIYSPFSGGVHACPGRTIAELLVKALAVSWFRLTGDSAEIANGGKAPALSFERATIAQRKAPCVISFSANEVHEG